MMTRHLRGVLSECVSTGVHTFGRIFTIYMALYMAFYINVTAGMSEYGVKLEC